MKPPKRYRKVLEKSDSSLHPQFGSKFVLKEKQALVKALRRFQPDDVENIQKYFLPQRNVKEIEMYLRKMKNNAKVAKLPDVDVRDKAPIELWLQMCEDLMHYDDDYSFMLSQVMSIIGNLEPHQDVNSRSDPDYSKIYKYLAVILRGQTAPRLSAIESAIVLDVLNSISTRLGSLDTSQQEFVMKHKYQLLSTLNKVSYKDSFQIIKQALEEDPLAKSTVCNTLLESTDSSACNSASSASTSGVQDKESSHDSSPVEKVVKSRPYWRFMSTPKIMDPRPTKGPFYSLNPFCVPIKYLNPKEKPAVLATNGLQENIQLKITIDSSTPSTND